MAVKRFFLPHSVLAAAWVAIALSGLSAKISQQALIACVITAGALLLAVRFRSLRGFLGVAALTGQLAFVLLSGPGPLLVQWSIFLLFMNFGLMILVEDAFFDWHAVGWWMGLVIVQWLALFALAYLAPNAVRGAAALTIAPSLWGGLELFGAGAILAMLLLLGRFIYSPDAVSAGLFWGCAALLPVLRTPATAYLSVAVAALLITISVLERSHWIAYHDELTGLPGRRAFNEAVAGLGERYCVAIADIDHFKKFNDTFGHDTGDQVLRKVATKLSRVSGGGKAFRCGGEEFAVLFPDGDLESSFLHLEELRATIERDVFVVRGPDRSKRKRIERRSTRKGKHAAAVGAGVTVSFGVAVPTDGRTPEEVLAAADKALYQAKANGRNRIEAAPTSRHAAEA